jgi:predicted dehydrogenase
MIAAAAAAGVRLMIAHSRRFTARYMTVRRLLDSGAVGRPVLVRENERRPRTQYTELKVGVQPWRPEGGRSWRDLSRYSGGVVRGHAIHEMDLFRWFAGADARAVYAETKITVPGREVADAVSIHVEFENGVLAACDLYSQAPADYPYYHQLEIIGTEGILRACDRDMITLTAYDGHGMRYPAAYESLLHITDAYAREQRLFFEAITEDRPLPLDPSDARAALELALAATHSAETHRRVELPLAFAKIKEAS